MACLLALLRQMSDRHYQKLLQAFSSKDNLRVSSAAIDSCLMPLGTHQTEHEDTTEISVKKDKVEKRNCNMLPDH